MPMLETIRLGSDALDGVVMDSDSTVTMKSKQFALLLISFQICRGFEASSRKEIVCVL